MDVRRLARGSLDWDQLEALCRELARRLDRSDVHVTFLDVDNWSSIPMTVNDEFFVKVVTPQHTLVHAVLTGARNLGVLSSGSPGFFERFDGPLEMADHELDAVRSMRALGVNAPAPVEAFAFEDLAVVVMEYLPTFRPLSEVRLADEPALVEELFRSLARLHDGGMVHGDLRGDNLLVDGTALHFIDATLVHEERTLEARGYDLACAIAIVAPDFGARAAVAAADPWFDGDAFRQAHRFLDFVRVRPDHDFDVVQVRAEIERNLA